MPELYSCSLLQCPIGLGKIGAGSHSAILRIEFAGGGGKLHGAHMHWTTPEERRALGQARRKQVGRQQHDQLNPKARKASALALLERAERAAFPPCSSSSTSSWRSRHSATSAEPRR